MFVSQCGRGENGLESIISRMIVWVSCECNMALKEREPRPNANILLYTLTFTVSLKLEPMFQFYVINRGQNLLGK